MDELLRRLEETLNENTRLKHQIVDLQAALRAKDHELLLAQQTLHNGCKQSGADRHVWQDVTRNGDQRCSTIELDIENQRKEWPQDSISRVEQSKSTIQGHSKEESGIEWKMGKEVESQVVNVQGIETRIENGSVEEELRQYLKKIREYVTGLTGYRIEFRDGEIVLHSLYAFDSDDVFVFRHKAGNMELANNEFASMWGREIENYLVAGRSIPAFLASVTLDLFNKKTFG